MCGSRKMKSTDGECYVKRPKIRSCCRNIYLNFFFRNFISVRLGSAIWCISYRGLQDVSGDRSTPTFKWILLNRQIIFWDGGVVWITKTTPWIIGQNTNC